MREFHEKVVNSNSSIEQLVKDIHSMLLVSKSASSTLPPTVPVPAREVPTTPPHLDQESYTNTGLIQQVPPIFKTKSVGGAGVSSVHAYYGAVPMMNMLHYTDTYVN